MPGVELVLTDALNRGILDLIADDPGSAGVLLEEMATIEADPYGCQPGRFLLLINPLAVWGADGRERIFVLGVQDREPVDA